MAVALNTTVVWGVDNPTDDAAIPELTFDTNPTYLQISPRKGQSEKQQMAAQLECYEFACEYVDWDPYQSYDELVNQGYAVALGRQEMEQGLICLAMAGAVAVEIAEEIITSDGDVVEPVENPAEGVQVGQSAAAGAAIGASLGTVDLSFINEPDNPQAQRAVARFERNLRKWEQKYSGCLKRQGYRVKSEED